MTKYKTHITHHALQIGKTHDLNPDGSNQVIIRVDQNGVNVGVLINGTTPVVGDNVYRCPDPHGVIDTNFVVTIPNMKTAVTFIRIKNQFI